MPVNLVFVVAFTLICIGFDFFNAYACPSFDIFFKLTLIAL